MKEKKKRNKMPEYAKMEKDIIFPCARHEKNKLPLKCAEHFLFAWLFCYFLLYFKLEIETRKATT